MLRNLFFCYICSSVTADVQTTECRLILCCAGQNGLSRTRVACHSLFRALAGSIPGSSISHFASADWPSSPLGFAHPAHPLPWQASPPFPPWVRSILGLPCPPLSSERCPSSSSARTHQGLPPHTWESKALGRKELCWGVTWCWGVRADG